MRAARLPETPTGVTTTIVDRTVEITWTAPYDGGSPIFEYTVLVRQSDGVTYTQNAVDCPGTDTVALDTQKCVIPFDSFKAAPYNLEWASIIHAKVRAVTLVGASSYSAIGFGAEILDQPDAP